MPQPMMNIEHLTRRYGQREALHDVTFQAEKGEVIALLGRNGAGKSTLMNILTGYLAMTSGAATIQGHDVQRNAIAARRLVGYLPEQPPLYPDMTVTEYLGYCAALKGIEKKKRRCEIERVIERTGLEEYAGRLSGRLSKGYRQRLGVAQALLGSPSLLILDEPGSGLDPLQMVQMRDVLREAGKSCTLLLSSHILSEVTQVCSRALVLEQGYLRYDGSMAALLHAGSRLKVVYRGGEGLENQWRALPGVEQVWTQAAEDCCEATLQHDPACDVRGAVYHAAVEAGAELLELSPCQEGLEQAFLRLLDNREVQA